MLVVRDARLRERIPVSRESFTAGVHALLVADEGDAAMAAADEVVDAHPGALAVRAENRVRNQSLRGSVGENDGQAADEFGLKVAMVCGGGDDDQAIDAPGHE